MDDPAPLSWYHRWLSFWYSDLVVEVRRVLLVLILYAIIGYNMLAMTWREPRPHHIGERYWEPAYRPCGFMLRCN